jgi:phosphoesterase RecJ-like protein
LHASISYNCAYNLYVAICTDTGSFRYECTRPRTMHIAAELLDRGVKLIDVGSHLYDNYTEERLKLLQMVLSTVNLHESGRIAFTYVSQAMLAESGAKMQDVEGFIDFSRALRSVKAAVMIKESTNGDLAVSLRAKGECDVAEIARRFDGGGHRNAAGFRCSGKTIEEIQDEIRQILSRVMNQ